MLVIHRQGFAQLERAVRITQDRKEWWVNPRTMVGHATGIHPPRFGCIVSFAAGCDAAGCRVVINECRTDRRPTIREFRSGNHSRVFVYWICGFAWALGEWEQLAARLATAIQPSQRYAVLEETGRYYMSRPWERSLRLIVS